MPQHEYTIFVRGEKFLFTKGHFDTDPGNYFSDYFFGSFSEGEMQSETDRPELVLYSDPKLFKMIEAHLCGYKMLPIPSHWIPDYMTPQNALENLKRDAEYYGLQRLVELVKEEMEKPVSAGRTFKITTEVVALDDPWAGPPADISEEADLYDASSQVNEEGFRLYMDAFSRDETLKLAVYRYRLPQGQKLIAAWKHRLTPGTCDIWTTITECIDN